MNTTELERLAKDALEDDGKATLGPWVGVNGDGQFIGIGSTTGSTSTEWAIVPVVGGVGFRQTDRRFTTSARTREPQLASAMLSLFAERRTVAEMVRGLKMPHIDPCDAGPPRPGFCAMPCTCPADEHNAKVDAVLKLIDTVDSARVTP